MSLLNRISLLLTLLLSAALSTAAGAADELLPRPPALEPDVQFWIKVYSQVSTNEGYLHDQHNLAIIYETLHFDADGSLKDREHKVDFERDRVVDILKRLGRGDEPATDDEKKVRALWGDVPSARLTEAADDVRFQLGQSDRFRAGLQRVGIWETHIAEVLANLGLPAQIAALPHVESSFDPAAYSKVGAAGLWQFMRSTGRRFLRIDNAVDERLDPFRETEAAAQLLSYNYRLLGTWPLAITAYNHGAEGVRRAREQLGTDDIVRIVRDYHSPSFGFASRNFYVSFLAALSIAQDPDKYFPGLNRRSEPQYHELKMPSACSAGTLLQTLKIDRDTLRDLNPALRPAVWSGQRNVPAGYVLRLPEAQAQWTVELLAQRLQSTHPAVVVASAAPKPAVAAPSAAAAPAVAAPAPIVVAAVSAPVASGAAPAATAAEPDRGEYYVVQQNDDLAEIAEHTGVTMRRLMAMNSLRDQEDLSSGQRLRLDPGAPEPETVTTPSDTGAAVAAVEESGQEQQALAVEQKQGENAQPVTAAQAQAEGPELVPGTAGPASADPEDYSVAGDDTIRVVAAETLGHYADWLGSSAARLRSLNHLRGRTPVVMGRRVKLEFHGISREQFQQRRTEYHERLEAAYFASHRIAGTDIYIARRGDSLWNITRRNVKVPVWLLQQYNPDVDFGDMRPGTQIALPKVEDVSTL